MPKHRNKRQTAVWLSYALKYDLPGNGAKLMKGKGKLSAAKKQGAVAYAAELARYRKLQDAIAYIHAY